MHSLFSFVHKIVTHGFTSMGIFVSSVVPGHVHHVSQIVTPTPQSTIAQNLTMHKTVNAMGKNVAIYLTMPGNGGVLEGTVSGDCQGFIDGNYSGQPQYSFTGKGSVTCTVGLLSLPANTIFTGVVHPDHQNADINYTISGSGFSKTGDITIFYNQ